MISTFDSSELQRNSLHVEHAEGDHLLLLALHVMSEELIAFDRIIASLESSKYARAMPGKSYDAIKFWMDADLDADLATHSCFLCVEQASKMGRPTDADAKMDAAGIR